MDRLSRYTPAALERRREYTRQWKAQNLDAVRRHTREGSARYREKYPEKVRARTLLNTAIRDGRVKRQDCVCGLPAEAHHHDYAKPYDVTWLCKEHHEAHHHPELETV